MAAWLEAFRVKITEAANETFGAWREGQHDDLLLAVALAAWMIAEDALQDRPYLAGQELSLAEITLGTLVYRWHAFSIERPLLKNVKAWYERLRERPAFKTHIEIPIT